MPFHGALLSDRDLQLPHAGPWLADRLELIRCHTTEHWLSRRTIFALPQGLIEALPEMDAPRWNPKEKAAELALANLATSANAIGFSYGNPIIQPLLRQLALNNTVSGELFSELGWDAHFSSVTHVNEQLARGAAAIEESRVQMRAYLGFLLTSATFQAELRLLMRHRRRISHAVGGSLYSPLTYQRLANPTDPVHDAFLSRWVLSDLYHWHAPVPQGPIPIGFPTPVAPSAFQTTLVPQTMRIRERSILSKLLNRPMDAVSNNHLKEWNVIKDGGASGFADFGRMPDLYYWLVNGLYARYPARIDGSLDSVDEWFGSFMPVTSETIRKTRLSMQQRLRCR